MNRNHANHGKGADEVIFWKSPSRIVRSHVAVCCLPSYSKVPLCTEPTTLVT